MASSASRQLSCHLTLELATYDHPFRCQHNRHNPCHRYLHFVSLACLVIFAITTVSAVEAQNVTTESPRKGDKADDAVAFNLTDYDDVHTRSLEPSENLDNTTKGLNGTEKPPEPAIEIQKIALVMGEDSLPYEEIKAIQNMINDVDFRFENIVIHDLEPSYDNLKQAVKFLSLEKPDTIIGSYSLTYAVTAEYRRIPYIVTSPIPNTQPVSNYLMVRLFPEPQVFARSVVDMLTYYNLKKIVVFYSSETGEAIIETLAAITKIEVTAFHVSPDKVGELREQLKTVRDSYFTSFVGILDKEDTKKLLDEAVSLSMFSPRYKWLMVNMGMEEYDLEKYVDSYANVTVIRLMMDYNSTDCDLKANFINLKRSVVHDALKLSRHLDEYTGTNKENLNMESVVKRLKMHGCTGDLMFSPEGHRIESFLQLMTLEGYRAGVNSCGVEKSQTGTSFEDRKGIRHILAPSQDVVWCDNTSGTWRSNRSLLTQRIDPSKSYSIVSKLSENVFGDRPLRITTLMVSPFVQEKGQNSLETNHPLFEGFCIDILVEMAKLLGFQYNITIVPDGKFGSKKPLPRGWTGMIRQLLDDKADIALAPFQMSLERAAVVDFTKPFMTKGTTVVVKSPKRRVWMFQFLSPLNKIVWFAIFTAFVGVSLMLFAVSRVNSDKQAKYTSNLQESFWYIWGTLLRGSLSGSPRAVSSRIVSSIWWFFCLIISSIYTANLAAFLTITNNELGMNSAADLALQNEYKYGTVDGSATEKFFMHTKMTYYEKMWAEMNIDYNDSMSRTVKVGFDRVKKGKYAFIWDSPTIRHTISEDCELMEIGSPFDLKGYGFAYRKNAPYGERLSWALLKLNDRGVLYNLERKWWRPQFCPDKKRSAKSQPLPLDTVAGMYVIILSGAIISTVICLIQYFIRELRVRKKRPSKDEHNKDTTDGGLSRGNNFGDASPRDEIMYANHSPLQFRPVSEWT